MPPTRVARAIIVAALTVFLFPAVSVAQSAITGVVTDPTGAVLPGVTVEAASPALIEKVRTAITDGGGRYRIEDLRPGTYRVTFTLPGFSTFVRDGFDLEPEFTASINAQLRVGGLQETVTVSGASPVVDLQSTQSRTVLSKEQVDALPTGRSFQSIAATVPALGTALAGRFDVGGGTQMWQGTVVAYGALSGDFSIEIDGMNISTILRTGEIAGLYHNQGSFEDMVYQVVSGSAESQTAGVRVNMVSKDGGNRFSGEAIVTYSNEHLQSDNNDAHLRSLGLTVPPNLRDLRDFNFSLGGPILKDRLWFFFSPRVWGASNYVLNNYNADGTPARDHTNITAFTTRITAQLGGKNKVTVLFNPQNKFRQYLFGETGVFKLNGAPTQDINTYGIQGKWTATLSSRVLVEAGYSQNYLKGGYGYQPGVKGPSADNPFGDISKADVGNLTKLYTDAWFLVGPLVPNSKNVVASMSYVTGSHNIKVGMQDRFGNVTFAYDTHGQLTQVYNNGVPFAVGVYNYPVNSRDDLNGDLGIYAQDSWKMGRLTFNPGLRFEHFKGSLPRQTAPAGRFVGARDFPAVDDLPNFRNWLVRVGAAYDLFGDGKTAVKASVGRYMQQGATDFQDRYQPMYAPAYIGQLLSWTDLSGNDIAEGTLGCVYLTPGCEINFAQLPATFGARRNRNPDPNIARPYQMVYNVGVTRELRPGLGVSANYYHRKYYDIPYTTDLTKPIDGPSSVWTPYQVPDPRGNGQTVTVYNIAPAALQTVNQLDRTSPNNSAAFHSVDLGINLRLTNGAFMQGGTATGLSWTSICDLPDPNSYIGDFPLTATLAGGRRYCDQRQFHIPWRTNFKLSGAYPLPFGLRASAVFQSTAGDPLIYNWVLTSAALKALTGVTFSQASINVFPLNEPGSQYYDRINQLDFTIARTFKARTWRIAPEVSFFNMLNANPVYLQTTAVGPSLGTPSRILEARLIRFGLQARF
jgi:hypothetical protein